MGYNTKKSAEAIFILDDRGICKEMLYNEFEAVLDGVVGIPEFADQIKKAVYVQVSATFKVVACVLFKIGFDEQGNTPGKWHVPFQQLCKNAGKGPNLGAGPIKLSCSSQCSVPWHQSKLWEPDEFPDVFIQTQEAITRNRLCLDFEAMDDHGHAVTENLSTPACFQEQPEREAYSSPFEVQTNVGFEDSGQQNFAAQHFSAQQWRAQTQNLEQNYSRKFQSLSEKYQNEITRLKTSYEKRLLCVTEEYEKSLEEVTNEVNQLKNKLESLLSQKSSLEEINEAQKSQINTLQEKLAFIRQQAELKSRQEVEAVTQKYESLYTKRLRQETQKWSGQLEQKDAEIMYRHEVVKQLRKDICDLRRDKIRLLNSGADKFLEKLEQLGINFIAFHAGAGHISIPLCDMALYMENPIGYAANKCLVSEEQYRQWLSHYENPTCRFQLSKHESCGCKIKRSDIPKDFNAGVTDRCPKHQSVCADWKKNVVNLSSGG